jgi:hypothetical protein
MTDHRSNDVETAAFIAAAAAMPAERDIPTAAELAGQVLHDPTHIKALRAYADDLERGDMPERAS